MVEVTIRGLSNVLRNLKRVDISTRREADAAVQRFALRIENKTVENITAGGIPFKPLNPMYQIEKVSQGYSAKPLVKTGWMRNSVRSEKTGEMEANVRVIAAYSAYHELGAPSAGIPERPFLRPAISLETPRFQEDLKKVLKK